MHSVFVLYFRQCTSREDYSYYILISYRYYVSCGWWGFGRCGRTGLVATPTSDNLVVALL